MAGVGIGIITIGYWLGLWGYTLIRGYDVSLWDLISTATPTWPPATMPASQLWPHTSSTSTASAGTDATGNPVAANDPAIVNAINSTAPALGGLGGGSLPAR